VSFGGGPRVGGKMPGMPKIARPAAVKTKIHPSAARIRLPQGNTGSSDPSPFLPGVGKL
jgi:hypothetical protein